MSAPQKAVKLTKKQKKGIAFRQGKPSKGRNKDGATDSEGRDVPVLEDQDTLDLEDGVVEMEKVVEPKKSKSATHVPSSSGQAKSKSQTAEEAGTSKKRRRDTEADTLAEGSPIAKRKKSVDNANQELSSTNTPVKQRFILFLGNLRYTTSLEAIKKHFGACDPLPEVRLLTPKSTSGKPTRKSKGCAFLEFTHRNALQQALKLHQSTLEGRMINVELTAGGGGKSEQRLEKVKQRNKQLLGQRKERGEKAATEGTTFPIIYDKPQRYSTTSGIEPVSTMRKTWTVGDIDDGETHRGGTEHKKRSKSRSSGRSWGTGVNAIPVG